MQTLTIFLIIQLQLPYNLITTSEHQSVTNNERGEILTCGNSTKIVIGDNLPDRNSEARERWKCPVKHQLECFHTLPTH